MIFIVFLVSVVTLLYVWLKWNYSYWERNKVPGPKPSLFVGNIGSMLNFSEHYGILTTNWYKKYSDQPYIGFYKLWKPSILLRDADIIKNVLITDFGSNKKNDAYVSKKYDPLFSRNPFFCYDDEWRDNRKSILPAFTANKLKNIMTVSNGVAKNMVDFIGKCPLNTDFDSKELCLRFTTQNVIKTALSIDARCFNKDEESEFIKAGKTLFEPSLFAGIKFYLAMVVPVWMLDLIPISFSPKSVNDLFEQLVRENKESRSSTNQSNDIFQFLLQIQEKNNSEGDLILRAHVFSLFVDGTETSSTALSYALYELARNPHCQDRLYNEIVESLDKLNAEQVGIGERTYLEAVILEAMRIHPPLMTMQKLCTKKYDLPKCGDRTEPLTIHPGTPVHIPVQAVHMDPKYYSNPEEFSPERFTSEEQRNRHKGIYLAFGEGPRLCPGMRFAIAQLKFGLMQIVKNFHIEISPNHKPIAIDPQAFVSYPKDGILLRFKPRS